MWLGTEDGTIHIYNCTDNIRQGSLYHLKNYTAGIVAEPHQFYAENLMRFGFGSQQMQFIKAHFFVIFKV
jgi:hypothetical protein